MLDLKMYTLSICAIVLLTTGVAQSKYVQRKYVATWEEAKQYCEKEGTLLASPVDKETLQDMKALIGKNNHTSAYFIGIKARKNPELQYVSLEGIPLDGIPEDAINMIEQLDPRDGDCLAMNATAIRAVPCWNRLPYICNSICGDPGYTFSSTGSCYKLYLNHSSWAEANKTCSEDNAYLVIFNNENEAKTVMKTIAKPDPYGSNGLWVGIRDDTGTGQWRSVQGHRLEEIYNVWHKYSTNYYIGEACALVNKEGELFDYYCNYYYGFICEKDI